MEDIKKDKLNFQCESYNGGDEKSSDGINGKLDNAKERLSFLEEIIQNEMQRGKKKS